MGHREGKEDARKLQTAGSLLRKGHWQTWFGSIWTLEGDDPGDWEPASCLNPPSPSIPSLSTAHRELPMCLWPNILPRGNAIGWKSKPWAIFYAQEET